VQTALTVDEVFKRSWKRRRVAFYLVLAVYFAAIAFYFGPNHLLFGKLTWITPADLRRLRE